METLVVIFLALVWACFAAKETTTNHLRGRELMADTVLMCYDDPYGNNGRHTFTIDGTKKRWARRFEGVTMGACEVDDPIRKRSDLTEHPYCRHFGSDSNGEWETIWAPNYLREWVEDTGAYPGECTGRSVGDTIFMEHDFAYLDNELTNKGTNKQFDNDDLHVMCLYLDDIDEYKLIVVDSEYSYDWFDDRASPDIMCDLDEVVDDDPVTLCIRLDDDWFVVYTDRMFKKWWKNEVGPEDFKNGHCNDFNISYLDSIEMVHENAISNTGRNRQFDSQNVFCMKFEDMGNNGEYHFVEVSDEQYDWFYTRSETDNECDPYEDWDPVADPKRFCVKLEDDGDWYLVVTNSIFKRWWKDEVVEFKNGHCGDYNINYADEIGMIPF